MKSIEKPVDKSYENKLERHAITKGLRANCDLSGDTSKLHLMYHRGLQNAPRKEKHKTHTARLGQRQQNQRNGRGF